MGQDAGWLQRCRHKLDPMLISKLQGKDLQPLESRYQVIVGLREDAAAACLEDLCTMQSDDQAVMLPAVKMAAGRLCAMTLQQLAEHPDVRMISLDRPVKALLDVATPAVESTAVRTAYGLTGRGVGIAVLDTGVYPHPDLTHPFNRLITLIITGIDFCVQHRQQLNIRVINLSLGAVPYTSYLNDPLAAACRIAWRARIVVCAAAGNEGPSGTIAAPGFDPTILTIGALDDANTIPRSDDRYAAYTSRGPTIDGFIKPDLAVPGTGIISLLSPHSRLAAQFPGNIIAAWYLALTGTSMATPICAGAAAQLLQAYPVLTPDQVKMTLMETAAFFQPQTPGYLTVSRAVQYYI